MHFIRKPDVLNDLNSVEKLDFWTFSSLMLQHTWYFLSFGTRDSKCTAVNDVIMIIRSWLSWSDWNHWSSSIMDRWISRFITRLFHDFNSIDSVITWNFCFFSRNHNFDRESTVKLYCLFYGTLIRCCLLLVYSFVYSFEHCN